MEDLPPSYKCCGALKSQFHTENARGKFPAHPVGIKAVFTSQLSLGVQNIPREGEEFTVTTVTCVTDDKRC